jgi:hypothetical protein
LLWQLALRSLLVVALDTQSQRSQIHLLKTLFLLLILKWDLRPERKMRRCRPVLFGVAGHFSRLTQEFQIVVGLKLVTPLMPVMWIDRLSCN